VGFGQACHGRGDPCNEDIELGRVFGWSADVLVDLEQWLGGGAALELGRGGAQDQVDAGGSPLPPALGKLSAEGQPLGN